MSTMEDDYNRSQDRIRRAQEELRTETDPTVRVSLKHVIEHEMAVWN